MAQQFAPTVRIVNRIDESQLVTLKGNTHPFANARNDQGKVSDSLPMTDLIMVLSRSPEQQAAFDKFVASQYDSTSPNFHQWLTPEQVGANFGPSETDISTISTWLAGHGFSVDEVTKDHMSIRFSGTAGQVRSAFHTEIHNLQVKGVAHIGNMSDPLIPAALSPAVVGIKSLHNFFPRPLHHLGSQVTRDAATGKWQRVAEGAAVRPTMSGAAGQLVGPQVPNAAAKGSSSNSADTAAVTAKPQFTISVGGTDAYLDEDVGPYDFATIYNILPLWNASTPIDGTGQTIAIAGTSAINIGTSIAGANGQNDVATFRSTFGLPNNIAANTPILISGNSQPLTVCASTTSTLCGVDDLVENSLDVEWSGSVAKNAQIILVSSYPASASDDNLYDSESYIVNHLTARIMNVSYGECEMGNGTAGNVQYYDLWQQAAAEGIAVFVAAGDSASASCDDGGDAQYGVPYEAEYGLSVSGLASTPYNTAVGGTDFNWCPLDTAFNTICTAAPHWSTANTSSAAGQSSALGYVPEVPWNDTCANPLTLTFLEDFAKQVYGINSGINNTEQACNFINDYAYGDGPYSLAYIDSGILYIVDTVGGSGGASGCVVSSAAGVCTAGSTSTGATTNPDTGAAQGSLPLYNNGWIKPSWQTGVQGIPSDGVRDIPDVSFFASDGYLSSSAYLICVSAVSACSYSTYTEPFYQEVGGTSVATPAMAGVMALINQKTGASQGSPNVELYKLAAKQSYSSCSAETVTTSSSCYFNDIDTGNNAVPCDKYDASPNCTTISTGTLGYAENVGILTGYNAGTGYDLATGLGSLNIANVVNAWTATVGTATPTITVTPAQSSINANNTLSVTITVASTPAGGTTPTGTVTLTASGSTYSASGTLSSSGSITITIPANSLGAGLDTLTAQYAGDGLYAAGHNSAQVTVNTVVLLVPTITVTPASSTLSSNASLVVSGTVTGNGVIPLAGTGTVTVSSGSYSSGPLTLTSGAYSVTIPANTLGAGTDAILATFTGDANYQSVSKSANVTVTESTFTLSVTTAPTTIASPGGSTSAVVTVNAVGGYTGTVTFSCSQTAGPSNGGGDAPTCSGPTAGVSVGFGATFAVGTSAPIAELTLPRTNGHGRGWAGAGGGAVLALLMFFGIPARRRSWRSMLGMLVLMVALGSLAGCGGGGSNSGGGGNSDPGTAAGTYTFTVTGIGSPSVTPTPTTTFTVTVN
jgi:hypothetical protein